MPPMLTLTIPIRKVNQKKSMEDESIISVHIFRDDQKTHCCKLDLLYVYICHGNLVPCLLVEENFDKMKM